MLRRLRQIFRRYADQHATLRGATLELTGAEGVLLGHVDRVDLREGRIVVEGWIDGQDVMLALPGQQVQQAPNLARADVVQNHPNLSIARPGFVISVPYRSGSVALGMTRHQKQFIFSLEAFSFKQVRRARRRLFVPFLWAGLRAVLPVVVWRFSRDETRKQRMRARIKRIFGFSDNPVAELAEMNPTLTAQTPEAGVQQDLEMLDAAEITIILPVYNAFDLLQECLARVVAHTDIPWHMVVVEDCSPDAEVRPWLADWVHAQNIKTPGRITLIENPENRGFIRSVNSAFDVAMARGHPVVLLNSDALVPANWARRLIRPIFTHDNVASVTPMSNDAEIFTAPVLCQRTMLAPGEADLIDKIAAQFAPDADLAEAPTGVGFCMAINIKYLMQVPQFDTSFGRGYGEEVDWCQKVRALGGRHLGLPGLFVEHRGGQSFGSDEKLKLVQANNRVIATRYADYDAEVQDFIRHDPLGTPRLALALAWAGVRTATQGHALPVYITHSLGGGAEHYLEQRIATDIAGGGKDAADVAVILRVGGAFRWHLEVHSQYGITQGATNDFAFMQSILASIPALHIIYSNGVGDSDPVTLPARILDLKRGKQDSIEVLFHDFYPLSPSYTLLSDRGRFEGVPEASLRAIAHQIRRPDGRAVPLLEWRKAWGMLIAAADEVRVFSQDSADHVRAAYPDSMPTIVRHKLGKTPKRVPTPALDTKPVIGVLGNIGLQKGAALLAAMGKHVAPGELVLIGNVDPAYDLGPNIVVHGDYKPEDISGLAQSYGLHCWLIPSIWPETFSYTTHECLATGLPVWSFDLGAQGEAISEALKSGAPGGLLPLDQIDHPKNILTRLAMPAQPTKWHKS